MKTIQTLIWSEWRRQRKTILLLIGSTVILWLFMTIMEQFKLFLTEIEMTAAALVIGLPFLYCIALGGSFASEFYNKSKSFLLGLPISKTKIYFAKYLSNLLIFLLISVVSSLLMYTLTDLTPGKAFFDDLGMWTLQTAMTALVIVWILSHTTVFLYNLISRNTSSGIIALLTLPVIFVILSFGTASFTMFIFAEDENWIIAYPLLSSIIIYLFMIGFGWYLWDKRISRDLKTLTPISIAIIALLAIPALFYGFAYKYTIYQFDSALKEARQSGLELEITRKAQPAKIPDASNGMIDIMQFSENENQLWNNKIYEKISKIFPLERMACWTNPNSREYVMPEKQTKAASYILNNPDMRKLYSTIKKALNKPEIQYIIQYKEDNMVKNWSSDYKHISATSKAIYFLLDRAYTQRCFGNNKAFFKSLTDAINLFKLIKQIQHNNTRHIGRRVIINIYNTIIKAGPEGFAYTNDYINALNAIENDKIYNPPYISYVAESFSVYKKMPNFYTSEPVLKLGTSICHTLRFRQSLAYWIRSKIEHNNLYLEAEKTDCVKKIIEKYRLLNKNRANSIGQLRPYFWEIKNYFLSRSKIAGDKVCLALKIYRCRYGKYPEKLQELCPDILKKIPLEPRTEKPYIYKREGKGFLLYGEEDKVLGAMRNSEYYAKTYYMKYQPWNPQGEERSK